MCCARIDITPAVSDGSLHVYGARPFAVRIASIRLRNSVIWAALMSVVPAINGSSVNGTVTVKDAPLLATASTVTTTLPVVAPPGTGTTMLVADQFVGVAVVPLNVTVLVPLVAPKFVPVIVTAAPTTPLVGDRLVRVA